NRWERRRGAGMAGETRHRDPGRVVRRPGRDVEDDGGVGRVVFPLARTGRVRDRCRHIRVGMALQAEERRLLRRGWAGPGQIRYGRMEREARAALHLGLRVAAGAVDLRGVTGQRGVAAGALELTLLMH